MENNGSLDYAIPKIVILYIVLFIVHTISVYVPICGIIVGILELFIIYHFAITKNIEYFLLALCLILPTTYEIPLFALGSKEGILYSCLHMPVLQGYPFQLALYIPLLLKGKSLLYTEGDVSILGYRLRIIRMFLILFTFVGISVGLFCIFINDNNIKNIDYVKYYMHDFMFIGNSILLLIYFIYAIQNYALFNKKLLLLICAFLISVNIVPPLFSIIGLHGSYGENDIIQMPLSFFFATSVVFLLMMEQFSKKQKILFFVLTLISFIVQIKFENALGGKSWLAFFFIIAILISFYFFKFKKLSTTIGVFLLTFLGTQIVQNVDEMSEQNNKLAQATQMLELTSIDNYDYLPFSPKVRIEEFINTCIEFTQKPYFLFGKGFCGSIPDHRNEFGLFVEGAFHDEEYENNSFVALHESINVLFLKFGVLGIVFLLFIFYQSFRNYKKCPIVLLGFMWVILFFNYSLSLALVGIPALVLGMYEIDGDYSSDNAHSPIA